MKFKSSSLVIAGLFGAGIFLSSLILSALEAATTDVDQMPQYRLDGWVEVDFDQHPLWQLPEKSVLTHSKTCRSQRGRRLPLRRNQICSKSFLAPVKVLPLLREWLCINQVELTGGS